MSSRELRRWPSTVYTHGLRGFGGAVLLWALSGPAPAHADEALAKAKGCMGCHAVSQKVVGPSFTEVAARYAKTPAAPGMVARNIRSGWKGAWGDVAMPAQDHVSEAEAELLARWVLAQRP